MSEEREVKRLYQNTAEGSRSVGRPRLTFGDGIILLILEHPVYKM